MSKWAAWLLRVGGREGPQTTLLRALGRGWALRSPSVTAATDSTLASPVTAPDLTDGSGRDRDAPEAVAGGWLGQLGAALEAGDVAAAVELVQADGWWRDLLSFTWDLRTAHGSEAITRRLEETLAVTSPRSFALDRAVAPEHVDGHGGGWIQAFFTFETAVATGRGLVRLVPTAGTSSQVAPSWKAWTLLTAMEELKGVEEPKGPRRTPGTVHGQHRGRENWLDRRHQQRQLVAGDPQVVIVGAGQGGLSLAARLGQLGVDTLVVERNERIGDSWRKRYHSLVLHDPVWYDHLPYLEFPEHWPVFTPKDKLANWFELYAEAMELNVWTSTELAGASYDDATRRWSVTVTGDAAHPDGGARTLHPRHLVLATGISGLPKVPEIPGAEQFAGELYHSSAYVGGRDMAGRRALVVGCCNSGHDIAQELNELGADVTILQRSSTYVMSSQHGLAVQFKGVYEEGGPKVADADLISASLPYALLAEVNKGTTQVIKELDAEMLAGLEAVGFKLDYGEDGSGLFLKYLRRGGGYYIDVGASALIASGEIALKQGVEIERFTRHGVVFADGEERSYDLVVYATGYTNMRDRVRQLLGDAVADRCTDVWDLDEEGELRTIWRPSGHPGFWFMGGNMHQARHYSKFLALQIAAQEVGLRAP
jgi:cation diffusion facilitator CzcD-associated flavoprotein CzcO